MSSVAKMKEWVNEHVPILSGVYENKYVGMLYDRFASLPSKQQRKILFGLVGGVTIIITLLLFNSYYFLWSTNSKIQENTEMINLLVKHQKERRDKGQNIGSLSRNSQFAAPGQLKQYLADLGREASMSNRMIQAVETGEKTESDDSKGGKSDVKIKQATVTLTRVTLTQLTKYMKSVESGQHNLSVSSIKILNDDKIRGYMKVDLGIVAYLFETEEG